jgi:hypothetical protein
VKSYREYVREMLDRRVQTYKERADFIYAKQGKRLDYDHPDARIDRAFWRSTLWVLELMCAVVTFLSLTLSG